MGVAGASSKRYDSFAMKAAKKKKLIRKQMIVREYTKKYGAPTTRRIGADESVRMERKPSKGKKRKREKKMHWLEKETKVVEKAEQRSEEIKKLEAEATDRKRQRKKEHSRRRATHAKLGRRTKKGQPVMRTQIEHLLKKIQRQSKA